VREALVQGAETIAVRVAGRLAPFVSAKDIALMVIGELGADGATYKAVEYTGPAVETLSISGRMTLCNLGVEMGAKATMVPPDKKTDEWLMGRARRPYAPVHSDPDSYDCLYDYDVTDLEPQVAVPFRVDNVRPVSELAGLEVDQVFIGTCTNGRLEDLEVAARIISGKTGQSQNPGHSCLKRGSPGGPATRHHPDAGGSRSYDRSAGMRTLSGCTHGRAGRRGGMRVHLQQELPGRMGKGGLVYLASPATAAASALQGYLALARDLK